MALIELVTTEAWQTGPWPNGGGITHVIATVPPSWLGVRLSVAEIDRPGSFSSLPAYRRWLYVLDDGGGLRLDRGGAPLALVTGATLAFDGDEAITATPTGPARVFNVIAPRPRSWQARVVTAPATLALEGAIAVFAAAALEVTFDGEAVELPCHATAITTAAAPMAIHVDAAPDRPAIVVTVGAITKRDGGGGSP